MTTNIIDQDGPRKGILRTLINSIFLVFRALTVPPPLQKSSQVPPTAESVPTSSGHEELDLTRVLGGP